MVAFRSAKAAVWRCSHGAIGDQVPCARRRATRRRHRAAAYTLIETLVVITIMTFLLASMALAIGTLFRAQANLQDDLQRATQLSHLEAQLRSDAHQASSAEQPDAATIVLHRRPQRIEYVVEATRVVRSLREDESLLHREVFPLAAKTTISWTIANTGGSALSVPVLSATVTFEPEDPTQGSAVDRLDAAIGLNGRPAE